LEKAGRSRRAGRPRSAVGPVIYVAFRYEGDLADNWYIDDVRIYEPNHHDVAAVATLPHGHVEGGESITPQAVVENAGRNTESFNVEYMIIEEGDVIYSEIASVSELVTGEQTTVDFPEFLTEVGITYDTRATTLLAGDEDPSNDEVSGIVHTTVYSHVPMMFLFTNSACGPCVGAGDMMTEYMAEQGNSVALMRIHTWWPNPDDIMYTYNPEHNNAYIGEFGITGVPDFWLDGFEDIDSQGIEVVEALEAAKHWASPMKVTPISWDGSVLTVEVDVEEELPPGDDLHLVCCITEDNIEHDGGNEELIHHQAFRYAYPAGIDGIPISYDLGPTLYQVDMPWDPNGGGWVFENLRATCYVQDRDPPGPKRIIESGTRLLSDITDVTSVTADATVPATRILGSFPNPFNPHARIRIALGRDGPVRVNIFDLQGRLITTLFEGLSEARVHELIWDGTDTEGNPVASGVYVVSLNGAANADSRKIVLLK